MNLPICQLIDELVRLEHDITENAEDTYWCGQSETVCERIYSIVDRFAPERVHELRLWQMNHDQNTGLSGGTPSAEADCSGGPERGA